MQFFIFIAFMALILKIVYHVLKMAKVSAFQNKSFFDSFFAILFKKAYLKRVALSHRRQNQFLKAGKIL